MSIKCGQKTDMLNAHKARHGMTTVLDLYKWHKTQMKQKYAKQGLQRSTGKKVYLRNGRQGQSQAKVASFGASAKNRHENTLVGSSERDEDNNISTVYLTSTMSTFDQDTEKPQNIYGNKETKLKPPKQNHNKPYYWISQSNRENQRLTVEKSSIESGQSRSIKQVSPGIITIQDKYNEASPEDYQLMTNIRPHNSNTELKGFKKENPKDFKFASKEGKEEDGVYGFRTSPSLHKNWEKLFNKKPARNLTKTKSFARLPQSRMRKRHRIYDPKTGKFGWKLSPVKYQRKKGISEKQKQKYTEITTKDSYSKLKSKNENFNLPDQSKIIKKTSTEILKGEIASKKSTLDNNFKETENNIKKHNNDIDLNINSTSTAKVEENIENHTPEQNVLQNQLFSSKNLSDIKDSKIDANLHTSTSKGEVVKPVMMDATTPASLLQQPLTNEAIKEQQTESSKQILNKAHLLPKRREHMKDDSQSVTESHKADGFTHLDEDFEPLKNDISSSSLSEPVLNVSKTFATDGHPQDFDMVNTAVNNVNLDSDTESNDLQKELITLPNVEFGLPHSTGHNFAKNNNFDNASDTVVYDIQAQQSFIGLRNSIEEVLEADSSTATRKQSIPNHRQMLKFDKTKTEKTGDKQKSENPNTNITSAVRNQTKEGNQKGVVEVFHMGDLHAILDDIPTAVITEKPLDHNTSNDSDDTYTGSRSLIPSVKEIESSNTTNTSNKTNTDGQLLHVKLPTAGSHMVDQNAQQPVETTKRKMTTPPYPFPQLVNEKTNEITRNKQHKVTNVETLRLEDIKSEEYDSDYLASDQSYFLSSNGMLSSSTHSNSNLIEDVPFGIHNSSNLDTQNLKENSIKGQGWSTNQKPIQRLTEGKSQTLVHATEEEMSKDYFKNGTGNSKDHSKVFEALNNSVLYEYFNKPYKSWQQRYNSWATYYYNLYKSNHNRQTQSNGVTTPSIATSMSMRDMDSASTIAMKTKTGHERDSDIDNGNHAGSEVNVKVSDGKGSDINYDSHAESEIKERNKIHSDTEYSNHAESEVKVETVNEINSGIEYDDHEQSEKKSQNDTDSDLENDKHAESQVKAGNELDLDEEHDKHSESEVKLKASNEIHFNGDRDNQSEGEDFTASPVSSQVSLPKNINTAMPETTTPYLSQFPQHTRQENNVISVISTEVKAKDILKDSLHANNKTRVTVKQNNQTQSSTRPRKGMSTSEKQGFENNKDKEKLRMLSLHNQGLFDTKMDTKKSKPETNIYKPKTNHEIQRYNSFYGDSDNEGTVADNIIVDIAQNKQFSKLVKAIASQYTAPSVISGTLASTVTPYENNMASQFPTQLYENDEGLNTESYILSNKGQKVQETDIVFGDQEYHGNTVVTKNSTQLPLTNKNDTENSYNFFALSNMEQLSENVKSENISANVANTSDPDIMMSKEDDNENISHHLNYSKNITEGDYAITYEINEPENLTETIYSTEFTTDKEIDSDTISEATDDLDTISILDKSNKTLNGTIEEKQGVDNDLSLINDDRQNLTTKSAEILTTTTLTADGKDALLQAVKEDSLKTNQGGHGGQENDTGENTEKPSTSANDYDHQHWWNQYWQQKWQETWDKYHRKHNLPNNSTQTQPLGHIWEPSPEEFLKQDFDYQKPIIPPYLGQKDPDNMEVGTKDEQMDRWNKVYGKWFLLDSNKPIEDFVKVINEKLKDKQKSFDSNEGKVKKFQSPGEYEISGDARNAFDYLVSQTGQIDDYYRWGFNPGYDYQGSPLNYDNYLQNQLLDYDNAVIGKPTIDGHYNNIFSQFQDTKFAPNEFENPTNKLLSGKIGDAVTVWDARFSDNEGNLQNKENYQQFQNGLNSPNNGNGILQVQNKPFNFNILYPEDQFLTDKDLQHKNHQQSFGMNNKVNSDYVKSEPTWDVRMKKPEETNASGSFRNYYKEPWDGRSFIWQGPDTNQLTYQLKPEKSKIIRDDIDGDLYDTEILPKNKFFKHGISDTKQDLNNDTLVSPDTDSTKSENIKTHTQNIPWDIRLSRENENNRVDEQSSPVQTDTNVVKNSFDKDGNIENNNHFHFIKHDKYTDQRKAQHHLDEQKNPRFKENQLPVEEQQNEINEFTEQVHGDQIEKPQVHLWDIRLNQKQNVVDQMEIMEEVPLERQDGNLYKHINEPSEPSVYDHLYKKDDGFNDMSNWDTIDNSNDQMKLFNSQPESNMQEWDLYNTLNQNSDQNPKNHLNGNDRSNLSEKFDSFISNTNEEHLPRKLGSIKWKTDNTPEFHKNMDSAIKNYKDFPIDPMIIHEPARKDILKTPKANHNLIEFQTSNQESNTYRYVQPKYKNTIEIIDSHSTIHHQGIKNEEPYDTLGKEISQGIQNGFWKNQMGNKNNFYNSDIVKHPHEDIKTSRKSNSNKLGKQQNEHTTYNAKDYSTLHNKEHNPKMNKQGNKDIQEAWYEEKPHDNRKESKGEKSPIKHKKNDFIFTGVDNQLPIKNTRKTNMLLPKYQKLKNIVKERYHPPSVDERPNSWSNKGPFHDQSAETSTWLGKSIIQTKNPNILHPTINTRPVHENEVPLKDWSHMVKNKHGEKSDNFLKHGRKDRPKMLKPYTEWRKDQVTLPGQRHYAIHRENLKIQNKVC